MRERLQKLSALQQQLLAEQLQAREVLKHTPTRLRLVAIVCGCHPEQEQQLSDYLSESLPDYMQPSQWLFDLELPRNANGKLDRRALSRQLHKGQLTNINETTAKTTPVQQDTTPTDAKIQAIEQTLSAIWAEVLFMDNVQLDDDYFELGGDSIASMQIVARASKHDLEFSTQDIMRFPSVRQLSKRLLDLRKEKSSVRESASEQDAESLADVMRVLNLGN